MGYIRKCFISGCENDKLKIRRGKTPVSVRNFTISSNAREEIIQQWKSIIPSRKRSNGIVTHFDFENPHHYICERHFDDSCFIKGDTLTINGEKVFNPLKRWKLTPDAVPTKFLGGNAGKGRRGRKKNIKTRPATSSSSKRTSTRLQEQERVFYKKDYYCSICLCKFTAGSEFLKTAMDKETIFLNFVTAMGKYLRMPNAASLLQEFQLEDHKKRLASSLYRTVCDKCGVSVERVTKLFHELQLLRMKLNSEILAIAQIFENSEFLEREIDRNKLKAVVKLQQGIKEKKNKFVIPRVELGKVDSGQGPQQKADSNASFIADKEALNELEGEHCSGKQNVFCGRQAVVSLVGGRDKIRRCGSCDKYFLSSALLQQHLQQQHVNFRKAKKGTADNPHHLPLTMSRKQKTPSPTTNDVNHEVLSPCPSPTFSDIGNDDNIEDEVNLHSSGNVDTHGPSTTESELVEPKQEVTEEEQTPSAKIPFMSSEYIGKYKILCKLRNLKTGQTCVGVVAKTRVNSGAPSSSTTPALKSMIEIPRVISIEPEVQNNKAPEKATERTEKSAEIPAMTGPPYTCQVEGCSKTFRHKCRCLMHYRAHMRRINKNAVKKQGKKCQGNAKGRRRRQQTDGGESTSDSKYLFCEVQGCRYKSQRQECLDFHRSCKHTPAQCHFCSETLPSMVLLITHEIDKHQKNNSQAQVDPSNENPLQGPSCPRCEKRVSCQKIRLRNHYATKHFQLSLPEPDVFRPYCKDCDRSFTKVHRYIHHVRQYHDDAILEREFPHQCSHCEQRFRLQSSLDKHQRDFHAPASKKRSQQNSLNSRSHLRKSLAKSQVPCQFCPKVFPLKRYWTWHMKKQHPNNPIELKPCSKEKEKEETEFVCETCGRVFSLHRALRNHMRYHQPTVVNRRIKMAVGKQKCGVCGKDLGSVGLLRRHMRRAHSEVPLETNAQDFVCEHCGQVLADKCGLSRHKTKYCPGIRTASSNQTGGEL